MSPISHGTTVGATAFNIPHTTAVQVFDTPTVGAPFAHPDFASAHSTPKAECGLAASSVVVTDAGSFAISSQTVFSTAATCEHATTSRSSKQAINPRKFVIAMKLQMSPYPPPAMPPTA